MVNSRYPLISLVLLFFMGNMMDKTCAIQPEWPEKIQTVIRQTKPLTYSRGKRLPLYLWPAMDPGKLNASQAEKLVKELNERGIGVVCSWNPDSKEDSFEQALPIARAQKKLGLEININATHCLYSFFDGSPETAHIDRKNQPFWDDSFGKGHKMGCPFTLTPRREVIKSQLAGFVQRYKKKGLPVDFIFADWEIDGPLEWNRAWEASKRCQRCQKHIPDIDNFLSFQETLRVLRSDLQRDVYADLVLGHFPRALVGNYAIYPHDGYRYWYDYFEKVMPYHPAVTDQRAKYRKWYHDFELTNYTFAMPVVYTWYDTWHWYDFDIPDYRWFYNMLRVGSNVAQNTPREIPVITFVHWHTTSPPPNPDPSVKQFSEEMYQELLWHLLLRGHDTFFLWCVSQENSQEVRLLHEVWSQAQQFGEFLEEGKPITYDVPKQPGPVVSALRLGKKLLVRRTDFTNETDTININVAQQVISVSVARKQCQLIELK
jgi:hypothetical protein